MPTKIRVMPTLLFKEVGLVKGVGFDSWRRVGTVMQSVKVYNLREVDELVFYDIAASREGRPPDFAAIDEMADECFMPLAVGGGITDVETVRRLLQVGADKVVINSGAVARPTLVTEVADRFGSQCAVIAIDCRRHPDGRYEVFTHAGTRPTGLDPVDWARRVAALGAGEIVITRIEADGTMQGYDVSLTRLVSEAVNIPVIASGGAGTYQHLVEALQTGGASAVAAAAMFHFTEQTPLGAKRHLAAHGLPVRL